MLSESEHILQRLHQAAQQAGLACLTKAWRGWASRYTLVCPQGHRFSRVGSHIVFHSAVCQTCLNQQRLARVQQAAQDRGGKCLERRYLGTTVPHRFECAHGHRWKTRPSKISTQTNWCPQCARIAHSQRMRNQDGLRLLQHFAAERGGVCLSTAYTVGTAYYHFQCAQGHQWETAGNDVLRGAWCRLCSHEAKRQNYLLANGLQRLQQRARDQGGVCLAQSYVGANAPYRFRCGNGHEWETIGNRVMRGAWCLKCIIDSKRLGIEAMHQMAHERGGRCLSEHYVNVATKLHWECHLGHCWHARPAAIRKGHWCPVCAILARIRNPKSNARLKYQALPGTA